MKNIIYFGLAIGFIIAMSLPVMAQTDDITIPEIIDTTVDEVITSTEDDIVVDDENIGEVINPEGTIGIEAEVETEEDDPASSDSSSTNGIWWAIGIVVVVGAGLAFTKKS